VLPSLKHCLWSVSHSRTPKRVLFAQTSRSPGAIRMAPTLSPLQSPHRLRIKVSDVQGRGDNSLPRRERVIAG